MIDESLSSSLITDGLGTRFIGRRVVCYPSLVSTMDAARKEAQQGAAEGTVIIADEQTGGKGRMKRVWLSPRGNIALSIVIHPAAAYLPSIIMLASLAVAHSIQALTGLEPGIKWPNDVLINGKKVCGMLVESRLRGKVVDFAIIGVGMNLNLRPADFPEISSLATSLSHETGRDISRVGMIRHLLVEFERLYLALPAGETIYEEWRDSLVTLGKRVWAKLGQEIYEGMAESVTRDGSLLLRRDDGGLVRIVAGDVTLHE